MRRRALTLMALLALAATPLAPLAPASATVRPRVSLTEIENEVMCVVCNEPLAVAQSPQAAAERAFIVSLIARGETKAQIERQLVATYGPSVLALPPARGFNLTVYVLPPAVVLAGIVGLACALPRWRARARAQATAQAAVGAPPVDPADGRRLEEDLARYGP